MPSEPTALWVSSDTSYLLYKAQDPFSSSESPMPKPRLKKTVCFSEKIMSKHKFLSMFLRQMEAIVYLMWLNEI